MSASEREWMSMYPQGKVSGAMYNQGEYHLSNIDPDYESDEAYLFMVLRDTGKVDSHLANLEELGTEVLEP